MATTEHTINDVLASILRGTRRAWWDADVVRSENTGQLKNSAGRPDILVLEPNASPVVVETEILPAVTVEAEAVARLGEQIRGDGRAILSSIAVRLPLRLRDKQGDALKDDLAGTGDLEMVLYTGSSPKQFSRWPQSGWLSGSAADLSLLAQAAAVPPGVIDKAADELVSGVSEAAGLIEQMTVDSAGEIHKISEELKQEDGEQTRRMATTILANAFVFQESLAGGPGELATVKSIFKLRAEHALTKSGVGKEWDKILKVNYWPIFHIALRILENIPSRHSKALLERLATTAEALTENRLMRSHDLTGAVFQKLIADRKFLAAFYTTPASSALLAGLALSPERTPGGGSWADTKNVKALRVADFACGTGTLLSTVYQRVGQFHELAGGDSEALHPAMMAESFVGCDVLPAAAHLTASMLAGAHPATTYEQDFIWTVPYGKKDGDYLLGSLELLNPQPKIWDELNPTAKVAGAKGEREKKMHEIPRWVDLVIMNPPFTRPTSHEGKKKDVPNPMFAAFGSSAEEQKSMGEAEKKLTRGTCAHGNAGEASIFLALADRKLKEGGMLALVMPLSLVAGKAWEKSRALIMKNYSNLVVVSIAGGGSEDMSFSADTGMGECLIVGRKSKQGSRRAVFVVLRERPGHPLVGMEAAKQICALIKEKNIHRLEDGPAGGTLIRFGGDVIGQAVDAPLPKSGGWNLARIADIALAQAAHHLVHKNRIWLPAMSEAESFKIPLTTVKAIGDLGPIDRDINGKTWDGKTKKWLIRGPFDIIEAKQGGASTYPVLWAHEAERERTMVFDGDSEAVLRKGATAKEREFIKRKAQDVWSTASHCHFNLDFQFNSQSTGMQFTPRLTIGGRAWLSVKLPSVEVHEKALVSWANTSLGMLLHWWHANKQQAGRGSIKKSALHGLPVLDVTALSPKQIKAAVKIFDAMCKKKLRPLNEIDEDRVRKQLDERFAREVLGLPESMLAPNGPLALLRRKLFLEPSIRGSKRVPAGRGDRVAEEGEDYVVDGGEE